ASLQRALEGVFFDLESARFLGLCACAFGAPLRVILCDVRSRYEPNSFCDHRLHVFGRDVVAVLDGIDSSFDGVVDSEQSRCMRSNAAAFAMRLVDDRPELIEREGRNRFEYAVMDAATAVSVDLDPVNAV